MFERTFSFWRRLLRGGPDEGGGTAVEEDRRLWVRYHAEAETHVQAAPGDGPERVSARIRDVSVGGASLITDRPFQPGQILSLEMPSAGDELQIVLACVVRAERTSDGHCSLGCVFSRELATEDLRRFGARKVRSPRNDKRAYVRYECKLRATYQRIGTAEERTCSAQVLNVSASGIGLILDDPVEPGSLLNLTLVGSDGQRVRTILACVVHSTIRASGQVAVGCNFIRELGEDELQSLL
jgi:hypothetical protein